MSICQYQQCSQLPGIFGVPKRTYRMPKTRNIFSHIPTIDWLSFPPEPGIWTDVVLSGSRACDFWVTTILSSHSFLFCHEWFGHSSQSKDCFALWVSPPWPLVSHQAIPFVGLLTLICLIWATLFAIFLHHEWSYSSPPQSASVLSKSTSTLLTVRGRGCRCRLAVTLCFLCDSPLFNVSCLKPCAITPY